MSKICQLCTDEERHYHPKVFEIDGMILCDNHSEQYIHSEVHPDSSIHRKQFDKLLKRMVFTE